MNCTYGSPTPFIFSLGLLVLQKITDFLKFPNIIILVLACIMKKSNYTQLSIQSGLILTMIIQSKITGAKSNSDPVIAGNMKLPLHHLATGV